MQSDFQEVFEEFKDGSEPWERCTQYLGHSPYHNPSDGYQAISYQIGCHRLYALLKDRATEFITWVWAQSQ